MFSRRFRNAEPAVWTTLQNKCLEFARPIPARASSLISIALQALPTSGLKGLAITSRRGTKRRWAMFRHVKVIGLSISLLVILSGLSSVSFALARHKAAAASEKPATAITLQSAEASVAAAATLRSIGIGY